MGKEALMEEGPVRGEGWREERRALEMKLASQHQHVVTLKKKTKRLEAEVSKEREERRRRQKKFDAAYQALEDQLGREAGKARKEAKRYEELRRTCIDVLTGGDTTIDTHTKFLDALQPGGLDVHVAVRLGNSELLQHLLHTGPNTDTTTTAAHSAPSATVAPSATTATSATTAPSATTTPPATTTASTSTAGTTRTTVVNRRGWTAMQLAAAQGNLRCLNELWSYKTRLGTMDAFLLHYAAANGQDVVAKWLLDQGVDKKTKLQGVLTASDAAAKAGNLSLERYIKTRGSVLDGMKFWMSNKSTVKEKTPLGIDIQPLLLQGVGGESNNDVYNSRRDSPVEDQEKEIRGVEAEIDWSTNSEKSWKEDDDDDGDHHDDDGSDDNIKVPKNEEDKSLTVQTWLKGNATPGKKVEAAKEGNNYHQQMDIGQELRRTGLPNLGNTCYINSVIQCLYHTTALTHHLTSGQYSTNSSSEQRGEVAVALEGLLSTMRIGDGVGDATTKLKEVAGSHDSLFQDFEQKEAHDFLTQLLQWLHEDLVQGMEGSVEKSFVSEVLRGVQESIITCPTTSAVLCTTLEPFFNISLPVTSQATYVELQDVLARHYRLQELEWQCDQCGEEHICHYQTHLTRLPRYLIIHLNRPDPDESPRMTTVWYPEEELTLHPYTQRHPTTTSGHDRYQLYGVLCHEGNTEHGHYTAFCRSPNTSTWYSFNDTQVTAASPHQVLHAQQAHILFYRTTNY